MCLLKQTDVGDYNNNDIDTCTCTNVRACLSRKIKLPCLPTGARTCVKHYTQISSFCTPPQPNINNKLISMEINDIYSDQHKRIL